MTRLLTPLFVLALAAPVWAQDPPSGLSLRGDSGEEIDVEPTDDESADDTAGNDAATDGEESDDGGADAETAADISADDGVANGSSEALDDAPAPAEAMPETDADTAVNDNPADDDTGEAVSAESGIPADEPEDPATSEDDDASTDADAADDATPEEPAPAEVVEAHSLSPAAPFLDSLEYMALRPASEGEPLRLEWSVQRQTAEGEDTGEPVTRTLILAPDFVRDELPAEISIYDFLANRHLEIDVGTNTYTNTAFAAEVRRRLDTYLGLSQGGRLDDIPLGPDTSFDRFWLEAAMGIRRAPETLAQSYEDGVLTVQRAGGLTILSAQFATEDTGSEDDGAELDDTSDAETDRATDIDLAAMPLDLSSGESVVFDPSQAASPINLNLNDNTVSYPDGDPAEQAQAELLRRWMRHALPIHPDALSALEGAPRIPDEFAFFVVSPESPQGRREVWTLQSVETVEPGFRLEPDLTAAPAGPALIANRLVPAALTALEDDQTTDQQPFLDEIEVHSTAGDHVRAYLVSLQEQNHNGACPPAAQAANRPVCAQVSGLIAAGLGNPAFEDLFGLIAGPVGTGNEAMVETLQPYLEDDNLAGAAARTLTAKALLAWAARDPEGPPEDLSPFDLFAEAIEIDPLASGVWWEIGNALLSLRDPLSGWTVFDTGRAVLPPDAPGLLIQVEALEDRLRTLAPEFFLPR